MNGASRYHSIYVMLVLLQGSKQGSGMNHVCSSGSGTDSGNTRVTVSYCHRVSPVMDATDSKDRSCCTGDRSAGDGRHSPRPNQTETASPMQVDGVLRTVYSGRLTRGQRGDMQGL